MRIATFAREMSANVTGSDSSTLIGFREGDGFGFIFVDSASAVAEKGRGKMTG